MDKKKKVFALLIFILFLCLVGFVGWKLSQKDNKETNIAMEDNNLKIDEKADKLNNSSNEYNSGDLNNALINDGLILIHGSKFLMGSPGTEVQRENDENQHEVEVSDFYISKYEVTQKEFEDVMGSNPSQFKGENLPVENVTWYEAIEFCNKLSAKNGLEEVYIINGNQVSWDKSKNGYRLPTEAEWEFSARASSMLPFSGIESIGAEDANFYGHYPYGIEENYFTQNNLDVKPGVYRQTTTDVGSFSPNSWGLYDIHGNVREWVFDWYGEYDLSNTNNPTGAINGSLKVNRGGGWNDYAKHMRCSFRGTGEPSQRMNNTGFRIARNADGSFSDDVVNSNSISTSETKNNKSLIIYFSWSGNTRNAAKIIADKTGADIFEIELVNPYSSNYNTVLDQAQRDMNKDARPKLKNKIDNFEQYDTFMIGYPNWWADIPMPIATVLEDYDFSGKTIIPFCSHGGGEFGQSITTISKMAPNSKIGIGLSIHYSGGSGLSNDISNWLKQNNIEEKR